MISQLLKTILTQHIHGLKPTPTGWHKRNCMMCVHRGHRPDKRGRFGIKYSPDGAIAINCFNCSFSVGWSEGKSLNDNFVQLLQVINVPEYDIKKIQFEIFKLKQHSAIQPIQLTYDVTHKWKEVSLPPESMSISQWLEYECEDKDFLKVLEYTIARRIYNPDKLYWSPSKEKQFNKRVLLPFKYKGKIVGYTARFAGELNNKLLPKYINSMPLSYVYNLDAQDDHDKKYCILNEGVLDGYITDGVSCLGSINQEQIALLNRLPQQIIVCPDRDKNGDHLVQVAIDNKWWVSFPNWGKGIKDASEAVEKYGRVLTIESIIRSVESNAFTIRLKRKMDKF